ncbi:peptidoglycan editing factor PgeF [Lysobacter silvisoli]|uniref:Purine nucleoside phosphorylase n=1 Tax=Lysobacter silvisoli TaxID=2293254 RepID=A0A371K6Q5_9GAMM|nr:peptidoglycan editing factor PgeF [Lysobacter silvisoli]RDZ29585.1 peptidoglycan editing factor PgeF [Lysobacter silvisoli]
MAGDWLHADWPAPPGVHGLTTLRSGPGVSAPPFDRFNLGARAGDAEAAVAHNRAALIAAAGLPAPAHWLRQVHGVGVHRVETLAPEGEEPEADAAVTALPGAVLAILTADCLPVLFAAEDGSEIGAAHAGWRGLAAGALEATVAAMRTPPARLLAWLGPAAGPQHYEVGAEVFDAFVTADRGAEHAFAATRPQHWRVDLYALARRRLTAAGLTPQRIHGGGLCTIADPQRFYSHRRDQRTGRMASLIWMDP